MVCMCIHALPFSARQVAQLCMHATTPKLYETDTAHHLLTETPCFKCIATQPPIPTPKADTSSPEKITQPNGTRARMQENAENGVKAILPGATRPKVKSSTQSEPAQLWTGCDEPFRQVEMSSATSRAQSPGADAHNQHAACQNHD